MNDSVAECTETLDPRVQIELERLNTATDEINRLEVELDEARLAFRRLLAEGHLRIQQLTKKLGTSVHKARPYYEARFRANITSQELHTANLAYDKANSAHAAAREMVYLAEQGLARLADGSGGFTLDPAWQEMLNHATHRVNQAEADRASATVTQRTKAGSHRAATALVQQLQNGLKRHIAKSRPYFEEKARINSSLESQKARIQSLEQQVCEAKQRYSTALRNLERISDEIHRHRSRRQSTRNDIDRSTITDTSESNASEALEEITNNDESVREWLRRADRSDPDTWTEIDLDYSSPEEISFEKCSLRPRSTPEKTSPPSPFESKVSAASPRRIILGDRGGDRGAALRAELERGRRQSLDDLIHDTGEKVKEMFQGLSLFGERRGSGSAPRTPRRSPPRPRRSPAPDGTSSASDERYSDTDSLASVEMLTDEQIASLMLDAQLEAVCERLAGVVPDRY
ncbi:SH3 domain-binding protein 5-like [Danaus plexippus]|uniref:SH3 domain-binding protein 5-like n=1 Tax=Danaus plexippus plexippus TaxID=278856 RepID=A0A212FKC2_DANPL|nr:SH3 domain-binding protein 5-like [Danaus plexippus]OWR54188.1 putative SH3-binding domain protein 5 [Danaus plexippus plexippus]